MKHRSPLWTCLSVFVLLTVLPMTAFAGPGGQIAKGLFMTWPGKLLLAALVIILLPLVLWIAITEWRAQRRTMAALQRLSSMDRAFDWLPVKDRLVECFHRVHAAWRVEEMQAASQWMTDWYWQNQQLAHLDRWARQGLINHCTVIRVNSIRPLFLQTRLEDQRFDGSRLVVAIKARMEDYLAERDSGKVVEGKKGYQDVETVWTFVLESGVWRVNNIESDSMTFAYARLFAEAPRVEAAALQRRS